MLDSGQDNGLELLVEVSDFEMALLERAWVGHERVRVGREGAGGAQEFGGVCVRDQI